MASLFATDLRLGALPENVDLVNHDSKNKCKWINDRVIGKTSLELGPNCYLKFHLSNPCGSQLLLALDIQLTELPPEKLILVDDLIEINKDGALARMSTTNILRENCFKEHSPKEMVPNYSFSQPGNLRGV